MPLQHLNDRCALDAPLLDEAPRPRRRRRAVEDRWRLAVARNDRQDGAAAPGARSRRHASSRAGERPAAGVLEELARIVRESGRLNRQT